MYSKVIQSKKLERQRQHKKPNHENNNSYEKDDQDTTFGKEVIQ